MKRRSPKGAAIIQEVSAQNSEVATVPNSNLTTTPTTADEGELQSRQKLARKFGVCTKTIERWQQKGMLQPIIFNPRVIRYDPADVAKLIASGKVSTVNAH